MNKYKLNGRRIPRFAIILLLSALSMVSFGASSNPRLLHEAHYEGDYQGLNITMVRRVWHLEKDRYKIETIAKNFIGKIKESEIFLWSPDKVLKPLEYDYQQKIFGIKRKRSVDFNWSNNQAIARDKDKKTTIILSENILGPLTYQLQMQIDMLADKNSLGYRFINRNKVKHYTFKVNKQSESKLAKDKDLVVVERTNEDDDKSTTLWLNPNDMFTLFRLEQVKSGKSHAIDFIKGQYNEPLAQTPYAKALNVSPSK